MVYPYKSNIDTSEFLSVGTSGTFSFSLPDLITNDEWRKALFEELEKDYIKELEKRLAEHYQGGDSVYPSTDLIFNALNITPLDKVNNLTFVKSVHLSQLAFFTTKSYEILST